MVRDSFMVVHDPEPMWSRTFVLLCLAQFLGYAHNAILTPALPLYVSHLGGSAFVVGLVLGAFSVTSVLLRPLIGYWADSWSDAGVLTSGVFLLGASVLLCLIPLIEMATLANAFRGIAWAGLNTGGYSLLANIAPHARRGETSGYYSGFQSSPTILFPAVSLWLIDVPWGGFGAVIVTSAALGLLGAGIGVVLTRSRVKDTPKAPSHIPVRPVRLGAAALVDRGVVFASALLLCLNLPHPAVSGFLVLYARELGVENLGWYFVASGSVSLLTRPILGRASDQLGRGHSMVAGFVLEIIGLGLLLVARNLTVIIVAGIIYNLGSAIGTATTMALAIDRADPQRRGVAMATFSVAFPLGVGVGAVVAGGLVEVAGYGGMFLGLAALVAVGLLLAFFNWSTLAPTVSKPNMVPR